MALPSSSGERGWLRTTAGHPSRWVALGLALLLGAGTVAVAIEGSGYRVTAVLASVFVMCFKAAFPQRRVSVLLGNAAMEFARHHGGDRR
jgi:hypothetical protein